MAKNMGDKAGELRACGNLGNVCRSAGDFTMAIAHHLLCLTQAKCMGKKAEEGGAYANLGTAFQGLGKFETAITYHNESLRVAKELEDKAGEGRSYGSLGNAYGSLGDFEQAIKYYNLDLNFAKELGDKVEEAKAHHGLGDSFESLGRLDKAVECYQSSVALFNNVRDRLESKDEWKIAFRNECHISHTGLWRALLKQGKIIEALVAAEKGRAQALTDLIRSLYRIPSSHTGSRKQEKYDFHVRSFTSSSTVFLAVTGGTISAWVLSAQTPVSFRRKELDDPSRSFIEVGYKNIGRGADVRCENRSMDAVIEDSTTKRSAEKCSQLYSEEHNTLTALYNLVIEPIADLLQGKEIIIVPDGPLWLAPYAAFMDSSSKYFCESFQIRLIPSLTSLKMITECPNDYHSRSGALLVGDPWVQEVTDSKGKQFLEQLDFAKQEVEMIGDILKVTPLTGKEATKAEVLKRLGSVTLVHIAAQGSMETGEIALTPDPERISRIPRKEDYILTMADVLSVQLRARLVVLSCCHSGRGEIKAEGVVGIARAFMGAGARSVLVSLWAIDDEATLEFMRRFYQHLVEGRSAGESLNRAMKYLRESDEYSDMKYWAPFLLIGDDVTLEFDAKN